MNNFEVMEKAEEIKPYTLRKLCADDIFPFCTVINQVGFKEFKACFEKPETIELVKKVTSNDTSVSVESVGIPIMMDVASIIFANLEKCKDSLYQLLSQLSGMNKEDIASLDIDVFASMIIDVIQKEEFKSFFKVASKLFN